MHGILGDLLNKRDLGKGPLPPNAVYVGRPSPWGNPFPVGYSHPEGDKRRVYRTRTRAIEDYRAWLWRQLQRNPQFLAPLVGMDLVCWCAPLPCHAHVIQKALLWRYGGGAPVAAVRADELVIAVTGSRGYPCPRNIEIVMEQVARDNPGARLLHGDARGADRIAAGYARAFGLWVEAMPADWDRYPKGAGFIRNEQMIARAHQVIAFHDGQSRGTAHAIGCAERFGLPVQYYGPEPLAEPCANKQLPPPADPIPPAIVTRNTPFQPRPRRAARREWWEAELGDSADQPLSYGADAYVPERIETEAAEWAAQQERAAFARASRARQDRTADRELGSGVASLPAPRYRRPA